LETNVLADRLGRFLEGVKEGPSRTTWLVLGVGALAVVLILVWLYATQSAEATNAARWVQLDSLATADALEDFINNNANKGTKQLRAARFELARLTLADGLRELGKPLRRSIAISQLKKAAETYEKLADETGEVSLLQEEALLGAARANESLGDLAKAKSFYERLAKEHAKSLLARDADAALARLNDEKNAGDLKALADMLAQTREPSLPPSPTPGGP
jgi:hypothetical protein